MRTFHLLLLDVKIGDESLDIPFTPLEIVKELFRPFVRKEPIKIIILPRIENVEIDRFFLLFLFQEPQGMDLLFLLSSHLYIDQPRLICQPHAQPKTEGSRQKAVKMRIERMKWAENAGGHRKHSGYSRFFGIALFALVFCLLPVAYCFLPTVFCLLSSAYCLLPSAITVAGTEVDTICSRGLFLP